MVKTAKSGRDTFIGSLVRIALEFVELFIVELIILIIGETNHRRN